MLLFFLSNQDTCRCRLFSNKDFDHFNKTRGADISDKLWPSSREEKLAIEHIANIHGEVWKDLR